MSGAQVNVTSGWPGGIAFIADSGAMDPLPESRGRAAVVGLGSTLACAIQDVGAGPATVRVTVGEPEDPAQDVVFEGTLLVASGVLTVFDAHRRNVQSVGIPPGIYRARVTTSGPALVHAWLSLEQTTGTT